MTPIIRQLPNFVHVNTLKKYSDHLLALEIQN